MRMYWAKHLASEPVSTVSPATEQLGASTFVSAAFCASAVIASGVMSGVPTIFPG